MLAPKSISHCSALELIIMTGWVSLPFLIEFGGEMERAVGQTVRGMMYILSLSGKVC